MSKGSGISIFLRVRPSKRPSGYFNLDPETNEVLFSSGGGGGDSNTRVVANNAATVQHTFRFNGLLGMKADQEEVFDRVAEPAVRSALDGYNSTVFAYGQTGSGKTFTITGGPERYVDRGMIPRSLSKIFAEIAKDTEKQYQVHISYLEIYNNAGYDLLDPSHETKSLEDLQRVTLREDEDGNVHLRGLTLHAANSEEDALNLLFLGDTNRAIAETPMNMASSRSHCVFTVSLQAREAGSDRIRRSKLHLVDLAGSERTHKTNSSGQVLREAQYINQSLHYLELVIVALHERATKGRSHVPYRNSMMTSILRDSLGGNCKTVMVATINPEKTETEEGISTCRFAQRVALVKNVAKINEQVDPRLMIERLKSEVRALREEVAFLKGQLGDAGGEGAIDDDLKQHDLKKIREIIEAYVEAGASTGRSGNPSDTQPLLLGGTPSFRRTQAAFAILREVALGRGNGSGNREGGNGGADPAEIARLKELLAHRDNEISILVNMVKQGKTVPASNFSDSSGPRHGQGRSAGSLGRGMDDSDWRGGSAEVRSNSRKGLLGSPEITVDILKDKKKAFDLFRTTYHNVSAIDDNKEILRRKYAEAKSMGGRVNEARSIINRLKGKIEQLRQERAALGEFEGKNGAEMSDEEAKLKFQIDEQKSIYKEGFNMLRGVKNEVERIQKQLEKQRLKMQKDFETWFDVVQRESENSSKPPVVVEAWHAPPEKKPFPPSNPDQVLCKENQRKYMARQQDQWMEQREKSVLKRGDEGEKEGLLTGNKEADDDIAAFFRAKEELVQRRKMASGNSE